jgi:hypothetical protein
MKDERREILLYICRLRCDEKERGKNSEKVFPYSLFSLHNKTHTRDVFIKIEEKEIFLCCIEG